MAFIEITRATFLSGIPAEVGETFEVDDHTASQIVKTNKGRIIAAPVGEAAPEPPKPKVKKVSGAKKDADPE